MRQIVGNDLGSVPAAIGISPGQQRVLQGLRPQLPAAGRTEKIAAGRNMLQKNFELLILDR